MYFSQLCGTASQRLCPFRRNLEEGELAGGLYGVSIGAAFFGESMFHHVSGASKVALCYLVELLQKGGFQLLDLQWVTPHLATFGAKEIPRSEYKRQLKRALAHEGTLDLKSSAVGSQ